MEFFRPTTLPEACHLKSEHPGALPLCGGTDVMVDINFDRRRPEALLDLTDVRGLYEVSRYDGYVRIGAAVPYTTIIAELSAEAPGLAIASRTVGSPQIRNRGSVGGNLGSASPAGDALPPLLAVDAEVEAVSAAGTRRIPIHEFFLGPKVNALRRDELIAAVHVPVARGPQQYAKVGTRNAMVIAVCSFSLALHPDAARVGTGIGSAAPTPRAALEAEDFLADELAERWETPEPLPDDVVRRFGELVAAAASPIDDVRGTADYRRHALSVLARRTLEWTWAEHGRQERTR
ncbi:MAG: FAD binding domain-containing protein [Geodermatophilaceae bacterium]|nr:FAD binding domain-containing protein [Geodermatophilaceae bacterium]